MASRRGGGMKVVAVGGVLAAALYIGSQMRGPGAGGENVGLDNQPAAGEVAGDRPTPGELPDLDLPEQSEPDVDLVDDLAAVTPPPMIAVLVKADEYLVAAPGRETRALSLDGVVDEAKRTTGSEEGIRVRIEYHESARVADEEQLLAALDAAAIPSESIQKKDEFAE